MNHHLTAQLIALLVGTGLPLITGYVTKASWGSGTKATILLVLSVVTGFTAEFLAALNNDQRFDWQTALFTWLGVFGAGVMSHYGFLKPVGLTRAVASRGVRDFR